MSNREEYVQKLKQKIDEWNAEIDELEVKAKLAHMDNRQKFDAEMKRMRQKRDELNQKLEQIREAGEEAWEGMKDGAELAWKSLKEAYKRAKSNLA